MSFTSLPNGSVPDQYVTLTTNTAVAIPYTLTSNTSWLTVLYGSATTPNTATLRVNSAGLPVGNYSAVLTLSAPSATNNGATIPVQLTVTNATQTLVLNPTSLTIVAQANGAPPPPRNVTVSSLGDPASYTVVSNQPWLQGIAASATTPSYVAVYVNPGGLAPGFYSGNLTIASSAFSVNLPVTLEITSGPILRLSQQSVTFNYQTGQVLPGARPILISASSGGVLNASITAATTTGGSWLQATPTNIQTPGIFSLSLLNSAVANLAPGTYSGTVTVTAPGTSTLNSIINVTLNVSATPC